MTTPSPSLQASLSRCEQVKTPGSNERTRESIWLRLGAVAVAIACCGWSADLIGAWRDSPLDFLGWLAVLIWLSPLIYWASARDSRVAMDGSRVPLLMGAVVCGALGSLASLNVMQHVGLVLACAAWLGWSWTTWVWAATGISWMPALGWLCSALGVDGASLLLRVLLSGTGAAVVLCCSGQPRRMRAPAWLGWSVLAGALAASLIWQFVPTSGAEQRLLQLPVRGPGFDSQAVALSAGEAKSLGQAIAVRRSYQLDGQQVLLSVIDGTCNRHAVHDPLYCFVGSGWRVTAEERIEVPGGAARRLQLAQGSRRGEVVYWFSDGRIRHSRIARYWWQTTLRRLSCGASGDEPVMVLLQSWSERPVDWPRVLAPGSPWFRL